MDKCKLVCDLIPLYSEGLISDETSEFIKGHLKECKECKTNFEKTNIDVEIEADTSKLKDDIKIVRNLKLGYYIPCYIVISAMIFISITVQLNLTELFFIGIISLIICGNICYYILKNIYSMLVITVICSIIVANNCKSVSYNIFADIYITLFPIKAFIVLICGNIFYTICGYFIAFTLKTKNLKLAPILALSAILLITSVPNKDFRNLWQKYMFKFLFEKEIDSYNNSFELYDFKYIKDSMSYIGYFKNLDNKSYRISSYGDGLGLDISSEYPDLKSGISFEQSDCVLDILISNGLKFRNFNDVKVHISNSDGIEIINPNTPIYEIEFVDKYNIFTPHSSDTEIELHLNIELYSDKLDTQNEFLQNVHTVLDKIKALNLYWDIATFSNGVYKAKVYSDNQNIDITEIGI